MSARAQTSAAAVTFQVASLLLDYPQQDEADLSLVAQAVAELPRGESRSHLKAFLDWWCELAPRAREEAYVATFELNARASLYLTARHSGDKRQRGRELLALREEYRSQGLEASGRELPDFLPLVLEFAAAVPQGPQALERERATIAKLQRSLAARESPFSEVVAAVLAQLESAHRSGDSPPPRAARGPTEGVSVP